MRFLDPAYARSTFPQACEALSPQEVTHLISQDGFLFLMDPAHYGYSHRVWLPLNKLWSPHIKRLA